MFDFRRDEQPAHLQLREVHRRPVFRRAYDGELPWFSRGHSRCALASCRKCQATHRPARPMDTRAGECVAWRFAGNWRAHLLWPRENKNGGVSHHRRDGKLGAAVNFAKLEMGRLFIPAEVEHRRQVVVLGRTAWESLYYRTPIRWARSCRIDGKDSRSSACSAGTPAQAAFRPALTTSPLNPVQYPRERCTGKC